MIVMWQTLTDRNEQRAISLKIILQCHYTFTTFSKHFQKRTVPSDFHNFFKETHMRGHTLTSNSKIACSLPYALKQKLEIGQKLDVLILPKHLHLNLSFLLSLNFIPEFSSLIFIVWKYIRSCNQKLLPNFQEKATLLPQKYFGKY